LTRSREEFVYLLKKPLVSGAGQVFFLQGPAVFYPAVSYTVESCFDHGGFNVPLSQGLVQLYTGNGKGKTTAAMGLAFRGAGAGLSAVIVQFMKGQHYSELDSVHNSRLPIKIEQYGSPEFCRPEADDIDMHRDLAAKGLARAQEIVNSNGCDILVLDEICTALLFTLITLDDIISLIKNKPASMELVLTGRGAPEDLYPFCDLITEMKEIKHYYTQGIQARVGIEY